MAVQVISFNCILKNRLGRVLSETVNREVLTCGSSATSTNTNYSELKALSLALSDLRAGEKRTIKLKAREAYGYYDPSLVISRTRQELLGGDELKLGELVQYDSGGAVRKYRVTELNSLFVTLDANHPLAGQDLIFEIEATAVRDARNEEVAEFPNLNLH